jgi:long-chain acyl-CoA synthetase
MKKVWLNHYPQGRKTEVTPCYSSLPDLLAPSFKKYRKLTALHLWGTDVSFAELDELSDAFASYLQNELGLKKGDRLAILLPNIIQFPVVFLGAQKLGVVCVPTNPQYTPTELRYQLKDSGAKAIVVLELFLDKLENILGETAIETVISTAIGDQFNLLKSVAFSLALRLKGKIPKTNLKVVNYRQALTSGMKRKWKRPSLSPNDTAVLQYTGGTTGVSKGAILSHGNLVANILQVQEWINPDLEQGKETLLAALPMFHVFGLTVNLLVALSRADKIILVPQPIPIENTVAAFEKFPISIVLGVNTLFNALNNNKQFKKLSPKTVKFALAGGMALQEPVVKKWAELTGNQLLQGFGLTEASPVTHIVPASGDHPSGSIGLPIPGTEVRIVDEQGKDVDPGTPGEMLIRGPQVMQGYWNKPEETTNVICKEGWLKTGDIATMDEKGFFFIVDRKKDMILVSGFNVFPNQVEEVLVNHPKVLEAAVIGVPHKAAGEMVKAFVVKKDPTLTEAELKAHCRKHLATYKVPRSIEFRDSLPKTNVGKILRRELRPSSALSP